MYDLFAFKTQIFLNNIKICVKMQHKNKKEYYFSVALPLFLTFFTCPACLKKNIFSIVHDFVSGRPEINDPKVKHWKCQILQARNEKLVPFKPSSFMEIPSMFCCQLKYSSFRASLR